MRQGRQGLQTFIAHPRVTQAQVLEQRECLQILHRGIALHKCGQPECLEVAEIPQMLQAGALHQRVAQIQILRAGAEEQGVASPRRKSECG